RAEYESIHGKIVSDWKIKGGQFTLHVLIPPNTTATVCLPGAGVADVREGGLPAIKAPGVTSFSQQGKAATFEVEAGEYVFSVAAR
ncbi:MAG TPA: alpha-L-rhamnosidase C-terminal domain-containing protein, partial [Candidatus Acidoferrales bacterium]|nr:alpha-L-rhamnosidase C-terminal domain-containing protein [Candidatus Acidoferrales bacterium]